MGHFKTISRVVSECMSRTEYFEMYNRIENLATCELRPVLWFLNAKNIKPTDIHHQIYKVYGENMISDSMVRKWVQLFNEGCTNVHNENLWLMTWCTVERKIHENRRFTILSLSIHFLQIFYSLFYDTMSIKLDFLKLYACWATKILTDERRMKYQGSALQVLSQYDVDRDDFLSHIVTGSKTWVFHVTPESKQ